MKYEIQAPEGIDVHIPDEKTPIVDAEFGNTIGWYFRGGSIEAPSHVKYLLFNGAAALHFYGTVNYADKTSILSKLVLKPTR